MSVQINAGMPKVRPSKAQRGLSLVEVIVATALTLLLFSGALTLYIAAAQLSLRTTASCYAVTDAANTVQRLIRDTEESRWLALPGTAGWISPGGVPANAFQVTDSGTTLNTGVQLMFSATTAATVLSRNGTTLPVTPQPYDRTLDAPGPLWIYRSDRDGTPNAASGACLWMYGYEKNQNVSKALIYSLSPTTPNAVTFSRPQTAASILLPYQLQVSLVSTYYSPLKDAQTSEINSTSQKEPVVGKCALLRDHEMNLDHEPNSTSTYGAVNASVWRSD